MHPLVRDALLTSPEAFYVKGLDGRYVFSNAAADTLVGAAIVGLRDADVFGEAAAIDVLRFDRQVLEEGVSITYEVTRLVGGVERTMATTKWPVRDAEGKIIGLAGTTSDVTDVRKTMREQMTHTTRLAALGYMAAGVGHEIGNPLTAMTGCIQILRRGLAGANLPGALADQVAGSLQILDVGTDRIRRLVGDLRTLSRPDSTHTEPVDLRHVVDMALAMSAHLVEARASVVRETRDERFVLGDDGRLGQVVLNLLMNAAQAIVPNSAAHNEIRIRTRRWEHDEGFVALEIEDTGEGILAEHVTRIFEPFFSTKASVEGSGLGLAITRQIVLSLGGQITAEARLPRGSRFRVLLRAAPSP